MLGGSLFLFSFVVMSWLLLVVLLLVTVIVGSDKGEREGALSTLVFSSRAYLISVIVWGFSGSVHIIFSFISVVWGCV